MRKVAHVSCSAVIFGISSPFQKSIRLDLLNVFFILVSIHVISKIRNNKKVREYNNFQNVISYIFLPL